MAPLTRADVERLLRQGLSLRQAAGALSVPLDVALAALEGQAAVVPVPVPVPVPVRRAAQQSPGRAAAPKPPKAPLALAEGAA